MGINAQAVRTIPEKWTPHWFKRLITNHLQNADFRNAIAGPGIVITGTEQQVGEISTGGSGTFSSLTVTGATSSGSLVVGSPTGGNEGAGSINAQTIYINGVPVTSGGSSNTPFNVTADTHTTAVPTFPATDYFEEAALDTGGTRFAGATPWTLYNQTGTAAVTVADGSAVIATDTVTGGFNWFGITQPPSGNATWSYVAKLSALNLTASTDKSSLGIIAANGLGNMTVFGVYYTGSGLTMLVQEYSSPTTYSSTPVSTGVAPNWQTVNGSEAMDWVYFKLAYDGTNLNYSISLTGIPGSFVPVSSQTPSSWIGTVTQIGVVANSGTAIGPATLFVDFWEQVA